MLNMTLRWVAALVFGAALAACGDRAAKTDGPSAEGLVTVAEPLRVLAAASLTDVLKPVAEAYATSNGAPAPVLVFASSSELARQIEQGADADVFISADEAWMDYLAERDLIDSATRRTLATNRLVLVAPADRPITLDLTPGLDLVGALAGGKLAIGDPDRVPAGRYAREALTSLGVWEVIAPSTARAESVRAALRFVETGEAAAGVVYLTDALAAGAGVIQVGMFPEGSHTPITYPVAATRSAAPHAADFLAFLVGEAASSLFEGAGFERPAQ